MFVDNVEILEKHTLFPCKSFYLMKFFVEHKKLPILSNKIDKKDGKTIWYFSKTEDLKEALEEWARRKATGDLFFKKL